MLINQQLCTLSSACSNIDNNDVMLSDILLPDLDLNIENEDYINILSHEGYQLK